MYYSMMLLPMIFTVFGRLSVMHNPVTWFGIYWCLSYDEWGSDRWERAGKIIEYTRGTVGWGLIVITAAACVVVWLVTDWRAGNGKEAGSGNNDGPGHVAPVDTDSHAGSPDSGTPTVAQPTQTPPTSMKRGIDDDRPHP